MSAAGPAVLRESLAQVFARAMQPDGEVVLCETEFGSHFRKLLALKINLLKQVPILPGNHGQQTFETLAKNTFVLVARRFGKLLLKAFKSARASALPAVNIDNRTAKNTIEPSGGGLFAFGLAVGSQCLNEAFLHNVLGKVRISQAIAGKRNKDLQVSEQRIFNSRHLARVSGWQSSGNFLCNGFRSGAFAWLK